MSELDLLTKIIPFVLTAPLVVVCLIFILTLGRYEGSLLEYLVQKICR